jgi:hypothetical protein
VLPLLTKYLIRYKRVCIPHVGTFEIVQQSPKLDVADKLCTPPVFTTRYSEKDFIPEHQVAFFSKEMDKTGIRHELLSFGEKMKDKIQQSAFHWKGFGTLRFTHNQLVFDPEELQIQALQAIPAGKVLRENIQHHVLVGEQQMTSGQVTEVLNQAVPKRRWDIIAGWIILALALIASIILLFIKGFQDTATGMQTGINL